MSNAVRRRRRRRCRVALWLIGLCCSPNLFACSLFNALFAHLVARSVYKYAHLPSPNYISLTLTRVSLSVCAHAHCRFFSCFWFVAVCSAVMQFNGNGIVCATRAHQSDHPAPKCWTIQLAFTKRFFISMRAKIIHASDFRSLWLLLPTLHHISTSPVHFERCQYISFIHPRARLLACSGFMLEFHFNDDVWCGSLCAWINIVRFSAHQCDLKCFTVAAERLTVDSIDKWPQIVLRKLLSQLMAQLLMHAACPMQIDVC